MFVSALGAGFPAIFTKNVNIVAKDTLDKYRKFQILNFKNIVITATD